MCCPALSVLDNSICSWTDWAQPGGALRISPAVRALAKAVPLEKRTRTQIRQKNIFGVGQNMSISIIAFILYIYAHDMIAIYTYIYWYCHISYCFPEGTMRTMMTISLPRSSGFHQGTRPMAKSFLGLFGRLAVLSSSFCQCRPGTDSVIGVAMVWVDHKYKCKRVECNYEHISAPVGWRFHSFDMFWLILCMKEPPAA